MSQEPSASTSNTSYEENEQPASKRWTHFHSALHLAIHRAAYKWDYPDFAECFELYCKEEPDGAHQIFNTVSRHMEHLSTTRCEEIFKEYHARENIDILHSIVSDARARRQAGDTPGKDAWRENLDPRTAVRARTIPLLRQERDRLLNKLSEMEDENFELQTQMVESFKLMQDQEAEEAHLHQVLEEIDKRWSNLPIEDIQEWSLRVAESIKR